MCGLAAALSIDGRSRMEPWARGALQHRGPDGYGVLEIADGAGVLEHLRLAIIDPDNREADQPFTDATGRWTIIYNGELFNYRAIRQGLERGGIRFRTQSDTEVVLQSLIESGPAALDGFRGMFAFVVWDADRRELFAARDQVGVKPLYYTRAGGAFVAASELRALIAHPEVHATLDPSAVVEYLSFGFVSEDRTLLTDVFKLPPGHALRLRGSQLDVFEYWDALPAEPLSGSIEVDLRRRIDDAVAASLVSDVPVSLMLSGGLDSSTIASLAARHGEAADLTAYSVAFGRPDDESAVAARLAADLGMNYRAVTVTEQSIEEDFDAWLRQLDVPSANPTWLAVSCIAKAVRQDGMKVLLAGDGGDELFGGYNRWMKYLRFHDRVWARSAPWVRRAVGATLQPLAGGLTGDIARRARQGGQLFVNSRSFHDDDLAACLGPVALEAAQETPPESFVTRIRQRFDDRHPGGDQLAWMSYLALKTDLVEDYLVRLDTMGMSESVEGRVPLLDPDLVRFAFSLGQAEKIGTGYQQKALFRRSVSTVLPSYITDRPKQGFCPPVADWATKLLGSRLNGNSALVEQSLISSQAISHLTRKGGARAAFSLWALGTLEIWSEANL